MIILCALLVILVITTSLVVLCMRPATQIKWIKRGRYVSTSMLIALIPALTACIVLQWLSIVFIVVVPLGIQTILASYIFAVALEWQLVAITNGQGKTLVLRAPTGKRKNPATIVLRVTFAIAPMVSAGMSQYVSAGIYEELKTQPHITESEAGSIQWLPGSLVVLVSVLLVLLGFVYWLLSCAFRVRLKGGKPHMEFVGNQFRQLQLPKGADGKSLLDGYFASVVFCIAGSLSTTWLLNLTSSEKYLLTPAQWGLWFTMLPIFLVVRQLCRILPDIVLENFRGFVSTLSSLITI